jgi:hypothetical protein
LDLSRFSMAIAEPVTSLEASFDNKGGLLTFAAVSIKDCNADKTVVHF